MKLTLELERSECIRGESVLLRVVIENDEKLPINQFVPPDPENEILTLIVDSGRSKRSFCQLASLEREGSHIHGGHTPPETIVLGTKQKVKYDSDVLEWAGELEPGDYSLTVEHRNHVTSVPVKLKVHPAKPGSAFMPRSTMQGPASFIPAAWSHKQADGHFFFLQQHSPSLPRNLHRCFRTVVTGDGILPLASIHANTDVKQGHLIWNFKPGLFAFAAVNLESGKTSAPAQIKLNGDYELLNPAMSMPNGELWLPLVSKDRSNVSIAAVTPDGKATQMDLALAAGTPLGPHVCFWENGTRLHFAWVGDGRREVLLARLILTDPKSGFVVKSIHVTDDPVLWIDGYLDVNAPSREAPYFEEEIPPDQKGRIKPPPQPPLIVTCVTGAANFLEVTSINATGGVPKRSLPIMLDGLKGPKCLSGVTTYEFKTVLLLADEKDTLHIASTTNNKICPLSDLCPAPVGIVNDPALVTATRQGRSPWVFLRYFDRDAIRMVKIEPYEEADPIQAQLDAQRAKTRRS